MCGARTSPERRSMTDSPWGDAEVSVTLKQSKDYAAPWIVVKGGSTEAVKAELAKATGLSGDGLTLTELVYNAAYSFQKISTVATGLDAVVIPLDSEDRKSTRLNSSH